MITVRPLSIRVDSPTGESFIFPTVVKTKEDLILVDAGYPAQAEAIITAAAEEGFDLKNLTKIVLTHHDFDHVGSLKALKTKFPNAAVIAPEKEAPFIEGKKKSLRLQQAETVYASLPEEAREGANALETFLKKIAPCKVDKTVKEGDAIDAEGLVVAVETPGHTSGHLSLYIPSLKTIIAGDALVYENAAFALANPQYAYNLEQAKASAAKLRQLHPSTMICYHGGICRHAQQTPYKL